MGRGAAQSYPDALVTGASSGIGAAFARLLAAHGTRRLSLVARRAERLEALAQELRQAHPIEVEVHVADLTRRDQVAALAARIAASPPDLLINNAGTGQFGAFADLPVEAQLAALDLNIQALVQLSHAYVGAALRRGHGALLQVASVAGCAPVPYEAVYAASKAFVIHFGEALFEELRGTGVRVRVLCPGFTDTEFAVAAGLPDVVIVQRGVGPAAVAVSGLAALQRAAPTTAHGRRSGIAGNLGRIAPRRLVLRSVGAWMRRGLTGRTPT
jgi:short-subunit dehydrogenase